MAKIDTKSVELPEDVAALVEPVGGHMASKFIRRLIELGEVPPKAACMEAVQMAEADAEETLKCILALGYEISKPADLPEGDFPCQTQ